jgi:CDP-glucose 4,6-dehydratase
VENLGLNSPFWRGRRVLLTGHTGFKGSWLLLLLESLGAEVTGVALEPPAEGLFAQINGAERCAHHVADIRDYASLAAVVAAANPEIVLHLAAQPLVRRSYADPLETIGTNVLGTANILQAVRGADGLLAVVSVTTDKCYANDGRTGGYRESDRLGGHDPYSNSKACAELVTQCYRDSFLAGRGVGAASARAGNVIGGGDYAADRLIPDIVGALCAGRTPELRSPAAIRPWQHVLEPLSGYCLLAQRLAADPRAFGKGWNFGPRPDDLASVATVAGQLARHWGLPADFAHQAGDHPHEAEVLTLDSTMALRELGWGPRLSLDEAIRWTAEWYRAQHSGADAAELCRDQIGRYAQTGAAQAAAA